MSGRPGIQDCPSNQPKGQALLQLGRGPLNLKHRQTYLGRDPCRLECLKALVDMQRRNRRHRTKVSLTGLILLQQVTSFHAAVQVITVWGGG